ncbi:MAG: hypothetical protein H7122_18925 [Chitinophagaceae bacterium]|nr:hypothetical protein [Chitinophagaceae bacterium]
MLLFYAENITPRLLYIIDFFSKQLFTQPITITSDISAFRKYDLPKLNYSQYETGAEEFYIQNTNLLFETDIRTQLIDCFEINFHKAFFETGGDIPFDVFAASFYLLSRYEEYLPHQKDEYGRYAHNNALAFKENFLHLPLVNIWLDELKEALRQKFPKLIFKTNQFKCIISYDIDIAYSFLHKGMLRTLGGLAKSFLNGKWGVLNDRIKVLRGKKNDPFDCYEWLDALHLYCRLKPYYFFLVARSTGKYDKNISTDQKPFYELIEYYASKYETGIHPSWQTGEDIALLTEELEWLEIVADKKIICSRQHYIRFTLPQTFRHLLQAGIKKDFSMGYGSINGFRASVCSSYYWYDLEKEEKTNLELFPFSYMDANSFYEQKNSPQQAYHELMQQYEIVKKLNGLFISIWHNNILGTDQQYKGWPEMFELFMKETVYWDAYYSGPLE